MDKYVVNGNITRTEIFERRFDTIEEANKCAEDMANKYQGKRFDVRYPSSSSYVFGLDDHHYQYDKYFKRAVQFCHND